MVILVDGGKVLCTTTATLLSPKPSFTVHAVWSPLPTLLVFMQARNKQLAKTMEEFDLPGETKEHEGEDLLDLLDAACSMK